MAGLTTTSLLSLYDPDDSAPPKTSLATLLGLPSSLPTLPLIALLSTAFFSISFLVFLNAASAFVLTTLLAVPLNRVGQVSGNLILLDEIWSLLLVLVYGVVIDAGEDNLRRVAVLGHAVVGMALVGFVSAGNLPWLFLARLVYAVRSLPWIFRVTQ